MAELRRIEGRTEPSSPEPALLFDGHFKLPGVSSNIRADVRSPLAIIALVSIVLIIVAGGVLVARGAARRASTPAVKTSAGVPRPVYRENPAHRDATTTTASPRTACRACDRAPAR